MADAKRGDIFKSRLWENYATFYHDVNERFVRWVYAVIDGSLVFPIYVAFSRKTSEEVSQCYSLFRLPVTRKPFEPGKCVTRNSNFNIQMG